MRHIDEYVENLQREVIERARRRYSEMAIDHWLNPRNPYAMENPDGYAKIEGSCGDTMEIFVRIKHGKISDASFFTDGCMNSLVSGSMAVDLARGRDVFDARTITKDDILKGLGGLPMEGEHCALLASNTLIAAIDGYLASEK
jgi:nitrogen fixation NifU-like protein